MLLTVGLHVTSVFWVGTETPGPAAPILLGVRVLPGADLQAMINSRPGGTTFCLKRGVHPLATGVLVKSYDRIIGEPGAVLDGQDVAALGPVGLRRLHRSEERGRRRVSV